MAGVAEALAQAGFADDAGDRVGVGGGVARGDEEAGLSLVDEVAGAGRVGGDDGHARGHRLQRDVAEGLGDRRVEEHVHRRDRATELGAALEAGEDRARHLAREPVARGAVADHEQLVADAAIGERAGDLGEDVEPLLLHQPAEEADRDLVVGDAERAAPVVVAARGGEAVVVDAARPDVDRRRHAPAAQDAGHAGGRHQHLVGTIVEARQHRDERPFEEGHVVVARVGLEPGVERRDGGDAARARPAERAMAEQLGRGDVDDVGRERLEVGARRARQAARHPILAATERQRDRLDADEVAGRREGGACHRRRVNARGDALCQQMADEQVERLVRPVADVIVVAAEEGDAEAAGRGAAGHERAAIPPMSSERYPRFRAAGRAGRAVATRRCRTQTASGRAAGRRRRRAVAGRADPRRPPGRHRDR